MISVNDGNLSSVIIGPDPDFFLLESIIENISDIFDFVKIGILLNGFLFVN